MQKEKPNAEAIRRVRQERVPPEPSILEESYLTIAVKHVNKGTITRFFPTNSKMNVYDWVGSLSIHPVHFKLRQYQSTVAVSDPAKKYNNTVLNMEESDTALSFDNDDEDVTMLGYSSKEYILERLEKKRNDAKMTVYLPSLSRW